VAFSSRVRSIVVTPYYAQNTLCRSKREMACLRQPSMADAALVIAQGGVYCGIVKFRWPLVIAYSALFTVFFHYEIRYTNSIWIEFVGGLIIYLACTAAYIVVFEKKAPRN
jgi:hypothetical protein